MLSLGLAAALAPAPAPAPAPRGAEAVELRWQAPAGCPEAAQARALVERLVPGTAAGLRASATIDATLDGFAGTLELHAGPSPIVRRLHADDCTVLARAMAVVIAVSLDPVAVAGVGRGPAMPEPEPAEGQARRQPARVVEPEPAEGQARRQPASVVGVEPAATDAAHERVPSRISQPPPRDRARPGPSTPVRAADHPPTTPRSASTRLEGGARIGAGAGGLLLPGAGVGLSLAPFLGTERIHVRAVAQYWAPRIVALDPQRDASGELQLVTGGVRVCPHLGLRWSRVRIPLCAGVDAGAVLGRGTGRDLAPRRSTSEPWAGAVLEPGVTLSVTSHVSLWLSLEGALSLYRPRFGVRGGGEPWIAGAGAVRGLFGVQLHARRKAPQNP